MKKNADLGAQLVKSLTFEVEATPQNNVLEIKNTENMTPLNVKVRVRKKIDGTSSVRKGTIAVPRIDLPDTPVERLRLASSDHTIMSFNMLMEADFEKKKAKKVKRSFFGICLGVKGEDSSDEDQYLPSASSFEKESKSESGVVRFKNTKPTDETSVAETSSNKSRKKDKFFGKCKPGGCLDPPFGEDKYAYQPQPIHHKKYTNPIDDTTELDLKENSDEKKNIEVVDDTKNEVDKKDNKPILNLYQGKSNIAAEENDPEDFIITYPPGLSSSGQLMADEKNKKNVVKNSSGPRHSRKSFNEFSSEYFSPPRTPRDSIDSQKDQGKQFQTKDILVPSQAISKSVPQAKFLRSIEKYNSKDSLVSEPEVLPQERTPQSQGIISDIGELESLRKTNNWDSTATPGLDGVGVANTGLAGLVISLSTKNETDKSTEVGMVSSRGVNAEGIDNVKVLSDGKLLKNSEPTTTSSQGISPKAWDSVATAGLTGVGVATTGLVGLGIVLGDKLADGKEKTMQMSKGEPTRDRYQQHSSLDVQDKNFYSEYSRTATLEDVHSGRSPDKRIIITDKDKTEETNTNTTSEERMTTHASLNVRSSPMAHMTQGDIERDLVFHGVDLVEGPERRISQVGNTILNRPIHDDTYKDLVPTGIPTNVGSERTFLRSGLLNETESFDENFSPIGMEVNKQEFHSMDRPINDHSDRRLINDLPKRRTSGSEGTFFRTGRPMEETNEQDLGPNENTMTDKRPQPKEKVMYDESTYGLTNGSETSDPLISSKLFTNDQSARRIIGGAQKSFIPIPKGSGTEQALKSREINELECSDTGLSLSPLGTAENIIAQKELAMTEEHERIFLEKENRCIREGNIYGQGVTPWKTTEIESDQDIVTKTSVTNSYAPKLPEGRQPMSSNAEYTLLRGPEIKDKSRLVYSTRNKTSTQGYDTSRGMDSDNIFDKDFSPLELRLPGNDYNTVTNDDVKRSQLLVPGDTESWANTPYRNDIQDFKRESNVSNLNADDSDKTTTLFEKYNDTKRDSSPYSKSEGSYHQSAPSLRTSNIDDYNIGRSIKHDTSVSSDNSQYRKNKVFVKPPEIGVESESRDNISDLAGTKVGHWDSKDGRPLTPVEIASHDSKGSSQKVYWENKDGRTATPVEKASYDSKGSSQSDYWENKDGRTPTPIKKALHDSNDSSQKSYWENKDERTPTLIETASYDSKSSSQRGYWENKDGRPETPIQKTSHYSRASSQKGYWENKDGRTAIPIGSVSHDSKGSSQKAYWENKDGRTPSSIGSASHDSKVISQKGYWENNNNQSETPNGIAPQDSKGSSGKDHWENKDGRTTISIESEHDSKVSHQKVYWENKDNQSATPIGIAPHNSTGSSGKGYCENKDRRTPTPIDIASHDSKGSLQKGNLGNKDGRTATPIRIGSHDSKVTIQEVGHRTSRESIFLNLAFQPYQDDNQIAIKTLDSAKNYDQSKAVVVKSLVRSHDKTGITIPIDSKHAMNIAITSTPVQEHKSRIPKPISKFDSGRSDYSNSTISIKDIGKDPHAALSMVFHQELVPLESIIRSLKEDIDSLAAQQLMLTDRLSNRLESQRIRPVYNRKCVCVKRITNLRLE